MVIEVAQSMVDLFFMVCLAGWVVLALSALFLSIWSLWQFLYYRKNAVAVAINKSDEYDGHTYIETSCEGNPELCEIAAKIAEQIVLEEEKQKFSDESSEEKQELPDVQSEEINKGESQNAEE